MRNIKSAIAAAGLFFVACCVPTAAAAPQPSFAEEPAPAIPPVRHSCGMFDAGVVFYSAITSPSADAKPRGIPKDEI